MRLLTLIGLLCFAAVSSAQSLEALDAQNGVFDLTFGAPIDTVAHRFNYIGKYQRKDLFYRPKDKLEFEGIPLESIRYIAWKGKLHSIIFKTLGEANSEAVVQLLETFYGAGVQSGMAPAFVWPGRVVTLSYEKNLLTHNAVIIYESKPMQIQFEREFGARFRDY
jgi:hypothetical protein